MRGFSLVLAVSAVVPFSKLCPQQVQPVEPGTRVRIKQVCAVGYTDWSPYPRRTCPTHMGAFTTMAVDSMVLASDDEARLAIPVLSVTRLERSMGRHRRTRRGALVGATAGGALGLLIFLARPRSCDWPEWEDWCPQLVGGSMELTAATLVATGALLGGGVGALIKTERWREVPLDRLSVGFAMGVRI